MSQKSKSRERTFESIETTYEFVDIRENPGARSGRRNYPKRLGTTKHIINICQNLQEVYSRNVQGKCQQCYESGMQDGILSLN